MPGTVLTTTVGNLLTSIIKPHNYVVVLVYHDSKTFLSKNSWVLTSASRSNVDLEVSEEEIVKFICRMLLTAIIELFGLSLLRREEK